MGRMATMFPGVRPSISFALFPTASTLWVTLLIATIDGSETTIPRPRAKTRVLAVPRSIARSLENRLKIERRFIDTDLVNPFRKCAFSHEPDSAENRISLVVSSCQHSEIIRGLKNY